MPTLQAASPVTEIPPAPSAQAHEHFSRLLSFETDCSDVHSSLQRPEPDFVLLDVRGPEHFAREHVPGAVNLPFRKIVERTLAQYPPDTLFVVYCDGVRCNASDRAAARLSQLGRPVKKMVGGIDGWKGDGFPLVSG